MFYGLPGQNPIIERDNGLSCLPLNLPFHALSRKKIQHWRGKMRVNIETTAFNRAKRLGRKLGLSRAAALGHLAFLWHWSQDELAVEAGAEDIVNWFDEDSEIDADPNEIIKALVECRFISETVELGTFVIHGNDKHVESLKKLRQRAKKGGEATKAKWRASKQAKTRPTGLATSVAAARPNSIQSNSIQSNPNQPNSNQPNSIQEGKGDGLFSSAAVAAPPPPPLARLWNEHRGKLPKVLRPDKLSTSRQRAAAARWRENPNEDYWRTVITRLAASDFCNGRNDRSWVADFGFLLRPETHEKVMEGKYDNRAAVKGDSGMRNIQKMMEDL